MGENKTYKELIDELTGWKTRFAAVADKFDNLSCKEKENILPYVNDLHMLIAEVSDRIECLDKKSRFECKPTKTAGTNIRWDLALEDN